MNYFEIGFLINIFEPRYKIIDLNFESVLISFILADILDSLGFNLKREISLNDFEGLRIIDCDILDSLSKEAENK